MMIYIGSFQRCQLASGGLLLLWLNYPTVLKLWRSLPSYSRDTHISNIWPPWKKKISLPAPSVESTLLPVSKHLPSRWPWEFLSLPSVLLSQTVFFLIFPVLFWALFCTQDWVSSFSQELCYGVNISCSGKQIYCVFWELLPDGRSTEITLV